MENDVKKIKIKKNNKIQGFFFFYFFFLKTMTSKQRND